MLPRDLVSVAMIVSGFRSGTRIITASGDVPVEALVDGELIRAQDGRLLQVTRVQRVRFDQNAVSGGRATLPVSITRGALGDRLPLNDLFVAPDQLLEVAGIIVPARLLTDGVLIRRDQSPEPITYFRIILDEVTAIVVEGIPVWIGEMERRGPEDADVVSLRERLYAQRFQSGYVLTNDSDLHVIASGTTLLPIDQQGKELVFEMPGGVTEVRVISRTFIPDELWPNSLDGRCLGVAVASVRVENGLVGFDLDLNDPRQRGLHGEENYNGETWHWTVGEAKLACPVLDTAGRLRVRLAAPVGAYWLKPSDQHDRIRAGRKRIVVISGEPGTAGHTYRVERLIEATTRLGFSASWMRVQDIPSRRDVIGECDILVIWRAPFEGLVGLAITLAHDAGAKVIFDIDDLLVDPKLARSEVIDAIRWEYINPAHLQRLFSGIRETALASDVCTCTTIELGHHIQAIGKPVHVLPNGFDAVTHRASRRAVRQRALAESDGLIRIGYAAGTRTHQRDMALAVKAIARLLREFPNCRLVLFRNPSSGRAMFDPKEFPSLRKLAKQVEWRDVVPLRELPKELSRFDINIAPLEVGNMFCEAKSELKFFEAALAGVCTVASTTGPFRRAIRDGETGFLAATDKDWYAVLRRLVRDGMLRRRVAVAAYHDALWMFGTERRVELLSLIYDQLQPGRQAARAFSEELRLRGMRRDLPHVPSHEVVHLHDKLLDAEATVIVPLYNYRQYIVEALDSVARQTVQVLDLVVVDDQSTDDSLAVAVGWVVRHETRFNRVTVLRNMANSGLGLTRNVGFAAAETPFVLPLDADNRLRPHCLSACLHTIKTTGAAYVYPGIQQFGTTSELMNREDYHAARLAGENYIDAMALVAKSVWAAVGGYDHVQFGWEDYDFWCRIAELGLWGERVDQVLADYRVHESSMLRKMTDVEQNKRRLVDEMRRRHSWLEVQGVLATKADDAPRRRGRRAPATAKPGAATNAVRAVR